MFGLNEALMSFIRRQVGLRTDTADPAGSLHAKVTDVKNFIRDLSEGTKGVLVKTAFPSANIKHSADTPRAFTNNSYAKIKEILVNLPGIVRVSFDLQRPELKVYGRVYVNGVAVGNEYGVINPPGTKWYTFTDDINVKPGDLVQLYVYVTAAGDTGYTRNFRISYDLSDSAGVVRID